MSCMGREADGKLYRGRVQVKDIKGDDVICTALNDAHMDGLLTVIHSERGGDGMSSLQTDLPLLTEYDEKAIKMFIKEHEVRAACRQEPIASTQAHSEHRKTTTATGAQRARIRAGSGHDHEPAPHCAARLGSSATQLAALASTASLARATRCLTQLRRLKS